MTETFSDVAYAIQAKWAASFAQADWPAVAALYAPETAFYGSTATFHTDPVGVLSYFEALPPVFVAARYAAPHILPLGHELFAASGAVVFVVRVEGQEQERPYRMTQVFRRTPAGISRRVCATCFAPGISKKPVGTISGSTFTASAAIVPRP